MPTLPNFISVNLVGYQGPQRTLGHTYLNVSDWKARRDLNDMVAPLSIAEVEVDKYAMGTDETRGLRVGMRPRAAPTVRSKGGKASGNSTANNAKVSIPSKGRSIDTVKDWAIIPKDDKALRVVVRADSDAVVVAYFALVNPDDRGLCEAVKIDLEEVFFAAECRDDAETIKNKRRSGWLAIIHNHLPCQNRNTWSAFFRLNRFDSVRSCSTFRSRRSLGAIRVETQNRGSRNTPHCSMAIQIR